MSAATGGAHPFVSVLLPIRNEAAHIEECLATIQRQDYPAELRELIVVDDAGQYGNQRGDGWRVVSLPMRFRTLGEKRNASAALVSPDVDASTLPSIASDSSPARCRTDTVPAAPSL